MVCLRRLVILCVTFTTSIAAAGSRYVAYVDSPGEIDPGDFCVDGMHPNDDGYANWAGIIANVILIQMSEGKTTSNS